jgi:hypothetical protein
LRLSNHRGSLPFHPTVSESPTPWLLDSAGRHSQQLGPTRVKKTQGFLPHGLFRGTTRVPLGTTWVEWYQVAPPSRVDSIFEWYRVAPPLESKGVQVVPPLGPTWYSRGHHSSHARKLYWGSHPTIPWGSPRYRALCAAVQKNVSPKRSILRYVLRGNSFCVYVY